MPEAINLVKRAGIVKELHWTYQDLKATPALWLEETVKTIGLMVEFENEKIQAASRR